MAISGLPKEGNYAAITTTRATPLADADAVVTLAAVPQKRSVIRSIDLAVTAGTTGGPSTVTVVAGSTTLWSMRVPSSGASSVVVNYHWEFLWGLYNKDAVNEIVTVTAAIVPTFNATFVLNVLSE